MIRFDRENNCKKDENVFFIFKNFKYTYIL
jgi:hypothetical protein